MRKGYLASALQESGTSSDHGMRRSVGSFREFSKSHAMYRSGMNPFLKAVRMTIIIVADASPPVPDLEKRKFFLSMTNGLTARSARLFE